MDDDEATKKTDVLFVGPRSEDGAGFRVVRRRDESLEVGELRDAKEGRPIVGELVKLKPRPEHERLFDVNVVVPRREAPEALPAPGHKGPARFATDAYRSSWERIFGGDEPEGELPN